MSNKTKNNILSMIIYLLTLTAVILGYLILIHVISLWYLIIIIGIVMIQVSLVNYLIKHMK